MDLRVGEAPRAHGGARRIRFVHACRGDAAARAECVGVSILPDGAPSGAEADWAAFRAGAAFVVDSILGAVPPGELARIIGCLFFASAAGRRHGRVEVTLGDGRSLSATARLPRPDFQVESNGFGAAHILRENAVLGLYVLEVAPGRAIPAHFHRVMQESELVLDAGLLLQGRPVGAGAAFAWSPGQVHAYRNPTDAPKRILCLDRPKFIPEDEVVVPDAAELIPVRPAWRYLG